MALLRLYSVIKLCVPSHPGTACPPSTAKSSSTQSEITAATQHLWFVKAKNLGATDSVSQVSQAVPDVIGIPTQERIHDVTK